MAIGRAMPVFREGGEGEGKKKKESKIPKKHQFVDEDGKVWDLRELGDTRRWTRAKKEK